MHPTRLPLVVLLVPWLAAAQKFYLGRECTQSEQDTIKTALGRVMDRADGAVTYLNQNPFPDDDMVKVLEYLVGANDPNQLRTQTDKVKDRLSKVHGMKDYPIEIGWGVFPVPSSGDVVIHCDTSRIQTISYDDAPGITDYYDLTTRRALPGNCDIMSDACKMSQEDFQSTRPDEMILRAVTLNPPLRRGRDPNSVNLEDYDIGNMPYVVQICKSERDRINNVDALNDLFEGATLGAAATWESLGGMSGRPAQPDVAIDLAATLEHVLLHEFTHLLINGHTTDGENDDCYGWEATGECRDTTHADTCAFVALAIQIKVNPPNGIKYLVQTDGSLIVNSGGAVPGIVDAQVNPGDLPS